MRGCQVEIRDEPEDLSPSINIKASHTLIKGVREEIGTYTGVAETLFVHVLQHKDKAHLDGMCYHHDHNGTATGVSSRPTIGRIVRSMRCRTSRSSSGVYEFSSSMTRAPSSSKDSRGPPPSVCVPLAASCLYSDVEDAIVLEQ